MPKKFKGPNSKAAEANERKITLKREEQARKEQEKEDAKWEDDDKHQAAKEARKKAEEEKRLRALQRKNEKKELEDKETAELTKAYGNKGQLKLTRAEIEREREREVAARRREQEKKNKEEVEEEPLEGNINQIIRNQTLELVEQGEFNPLVDARSLDEALGQLGISETDRNKEKRLKAAFAAYESANLSILRQENPSLKLSQVKEMLWKQWQKSPDNPLNQ